MTPEQRAAAIESLLCAMADGTSLAEYCRRPDTPNKATIYRWFAEDKELSDKYARAKLDGLESLADEITDIADNAANDWMERNCGDQVAWVANGESARRSQLRIDARKWLLSKLVPKKYGDKIDVAHSGDMTINWPVRPPAIELPPTA
jgi:hypothetical protein